jgi:cytochrome c
MIVRCCALGVVGLAVMVGAAAAGPVGELGERLYAAHCAECHGAQGRGGKGFARVLWGPGSDLRRFGTAGALLEYLQLTMPFDDPARLAPEHKQLITRYLLWRHEGAPAATAEAAWDASQRIR